MRKVISSLLGTAFVFTGCASTQKAETPVALPQPATVTLASENAGKAAGDALEIQAQATVKSVDTKARTVTLVASDGRQFTIKVGDEVKRLNEIKRGDTINVTYIESLAYDLRKPTAEELKNPKVIVELAGRAPSDLPPGAVMGATVRSVVKVVEIDKANSLVTVRNPEGRLIRVHVREADRMKQIKVGETAVVEYTEALVVSVEPAAK